MHLGGPRLASLHHLVFLPAGDSALTRRATKASTLSAVVVRWSRSRKRYERQGVLVNDHALAVAEQQCLSDQDARARRRERDRVRRAGADEDFQARLAHEITRLFPGCPPGRATAIARHTGLRRSGRVVRSAAGRVLDETAITRAVTASYATKTPVTTHCSCPACPATPTATGCGQTSTRFSQPGAFPASRHTHPDSNHLCISAKQGSSYTSHKL